MPELLIKNRILVFYISSVMLFLTLTLCGYYAVDNIRMKPPGRVSAAVDAQSFVTDMAFFDLPRMNVAVGRGAGETHVRLDISLEIPKEDMVVMEGYQPRITDRLSTFLGSLNPEQFQHPSSLPWLRGEMLRVVNSSGAPLPVRQLFFRDMLVM